MGFNVAVTDHVRDEFDNWIKRDDVTLGKGVALTGGIKAIMALFEIDTALAVALSNPSITIHDAVSKITKAVVDTEITSLDAELSDQDKKKILGILQSAKVKPSRKK